jgi:hypothetical protein
MQYCDIVLYSFCLTFIVAFVVHCWLLSELATCKRQGFSRQFPDFPARILKLTFEISAIWSHVGIRRIVPAILLVEDMAGASARKRNERARGWTMDDGRKR